MRFLKSQEEQRRNTSDPGADAIAQTQGTAAPVADEVETVDMVIAEFEAAAPVVDEAEAAQAEAATLEEILEEVSEQAPEEEASSPMEIPSIELLEEELKNERHKNNFGRVLRSTVFSLVVVVALAVIVAVLVMPVLQISGTSMTETLQDGDIVIAMRTNSYETGQVVAFYYNNNILVKRVIATSGDWVDIDEDGNVFVNGELLDEPYVNERALGECNITLPYQVPDGKCFLMGDHRATSIDSRNTAVGCIGDDMVLGRLLLRVWPIAELDIIN